MFSKKLPGHPGYHDEVRSRRLVAQFRQLTLPLLCLALFVQSALEQWLGPDTTGYRDSIINVMPMILPLSFACLPVRWSLWGFLRAIATGIAMGVVSSSNQHLARIGPGHQPGGTWIIPFTVLVALVIQWEARRAAKQAASESASPSVTQTDGCIDRNPSG